MNKLLRLKEVMEVTSLSRSTIYQYIKDNKFPPQIKLGLRCVAWSSLDIQNWIDDCIANSRT
jgi:prophage regulatory protein